MMSVKSPSRTLGLHSAPKSVQDYIIAKMSRKSTLSHVLLGFVVGVVVGATAFGWWVPARTLTLRAEAVRRDMLTLLPGQSTFDDARRIIDKYQGQSLYPRYSDCTAEHCYMGIRISNETLLPVHVVPLTIFSTGIRINGGVVTEIDMGFLSDTGKPLFCSALTVERVYNPLDTGEFFAATPELCKKTVYLTPKAAARDRAKAFNFRLSCLSRLGGCKTAPELLPGD